MLEALLRFLAFAALGIVAPGVAVLRLLALPVEPALVLSGGLAVAAALAWVSFATGLPAVFPAGLVLLVAAAGLIRRRLPWSAEGPSLRGAGPAALLTVLVLAVTQYPWNRVGPTGEFLLDPFVAFDTAFHVGLTRELVTGYPPQVPGVSGFPLGYHLGLDLVRAAALRYAAVDPYDSIARFDVTLLAVALILSLRSLTAALGGKGRAVALAGFIPLLTDLSFVFAANSQAHWWADLLRANVLVSLALANPVIPGLALALSSLAAFARSEEEPERTRWAVMAGLLALAVPFFKVFLGAHLLLGFVACAVLRPALRRRAFQVALPAFIGTAALALGQGGATVAVLLAPLDLVQVTRTTLGLQPAHGLSLAAWAVFWLAASLGVRAVGVPAALRALHEGPGAGTALAAMALSAWPLGLLFRVSAPVSLPGQAIVNDAAYLVEQGGPLLAVFAVLTLARAWERSRRGVALVAAALALSLPATVQFVVKKSTTAPDPLPAPMVRAMDALKAESAPGDVVMQRPGARYPPAPVILAGRRVPYERFTPWLTQFASPQALEARHETVFRFFRTTDPAEAERIARSLGARWLCLYGTDRVRFPLETLYVPAYEEPGARLFRLRSAAEKQPVSP
jgi:hypothetical protein